MTRRNTSIIVAAVILVIVLAGRAILVSQNSGTNHQGAAQTETTQQNGSAVASTAGAPSTDSKGIEKARKIAAQIKANDGAAPQGYVGGGTFRNDPLPGSQKLPLGVTYKEYDINPKIPGKNRGAERIVIGSDGSVWYTNDHYVTFTRL